MRQLMRYSLLAASLVFPASSAIAGQVSAPRSLRDWAAVRQLAPGTAISVKLRHRTFCAFREASERELTCDVYQPPLPLLVGPIVFPRFPAYGPQTAIFSRDAVQELRLEHRAGSIAAGAAIGTVAGAVTGANTGSGSLTPSGGAVVLGGIGALVGGLVGRSTSFIHGKVIYRR